MDALLAWLDPTLWLDWMQESPWLTLAIAIPLGALVLWRLVKGGLGMRRAAINVIGVGLVLWGTLWFADWIQPSLIAEDLFTPPVVGPQAVKAVLATRKTLERSATYTGAVRPFERVVLRARNEGFVEQVALYPGDAVKRGQLVVRLDTLELVPQLRKAEAEQEFLKAELKRDRKLFRGGAIAASRLELSSSKERVAAATVALLRTRMRFANVRAPSDGWVSRRAVDPGQYVRKGDHLLAYDRLERVRVRFNIAVQDLVYLRRGGAVTLEFPEIPRDRLAGTPLAERLAEGFEAVAVRATIDTVFPAADEKSRLGVVEIVLDNPGQVFKPNTYVVGHFVTARVENAWVIPARALTPMPEGKTVIFVAPAFSDQGEAEMREVSIGLRTAREVQIVDGIDEPAFVVVSGNRALTDGETVMVIAREGAPQ
jgi:membrane fusion protein, multidrug efflux system